MELSSLPRPLTDFNAEVITGLSVDAQAFKLTVSKHATVPTTIRPNQLTAAAIHVTV